MKIPPQKYITAVRELMSGIDLDPASCDTRNRQVRAERYYDEVMDGLSWTWTSSSCFLQPPGKRRSRWVNHLLERYQEEEVGQAVLLIPANVTGAQWFQPLWDYPMCFTSSRIKFLDENLKPRPRPENSNLFVYFPERARGYEPFQNFERLFRPFGHVIIPS